MFWLDFRICPTLGQMMSDGGKRDTPDQHTFCYALWIWSFDERGQQAPVPKSGVDIRKWIRSTEDDAHTRYYEQTDT